LLASPAQLPGDLGFELVRVEGAAAQAKQLVAQAVLGNAQLERFEIGLGGAEARKIGALGSIDLNLQAGTPFRVGARRDSIVVMNGVHRHT